MSDRGSPGSALAACCYCGEGGMAKNVIMFRLCIVNPKWPLLFAMKSMKRQSYLICPESINRKVFLTTRNSVPRNLRWGQLLQQAPKVAVLKK